MPPHSRYVGSLSPEYAFLGFLSQQPAHGYELHQQLVANLGRIWHVSLSQTYNILTRLEAQEFITGTIQEQVKLPARRRFRLTAAGRRRFDTWFNSVTGCSVRAIRIEFTTRLYFARATSAALARDVIDAQLAGTQTCLWHLRVMLEDLPPEQTFNRLGIELRIRQLTSTIDWLAECKVVLDV